MTAPASRFILALIGPAGCGKSTLAEQLVRYHNYERMNFSYPIKDMLGSLMRLQGAKSSEIFDALWGNAKEKPNRYLADATPRRAMQTLGTEWRDLISQSLWTKILLNRIERRLLASESPRVVIDDMRFLHEVDALRKFDKTAKIIRIERDGINPGEHISEREYGSIAFDFVIYNDGTPHEMLEKLVIWGFEP